MLADKRRIYTEDGEELFTGDEVARLLGVGASAVRTWIARHGKEREFLNLANVNLFTREDIEFFRDCRIGVGRPVGSTTDFVRRNR